MAATIGGSIEGTAMTRKKIMDWLRYAKEDRVLAMKNHGRTRARYIRSARECLEMAAEFRAIILANGKPLPGSRLAGNGNMCHE